MAEPIPCPAPDCTVTFSGDLAESSLNRLLDVHIRLAHPTPEAPQPQALSSKAEKVRRPTVTSSGTSEDWKYFLTRWQEYKLATRLVGNDVILQLMECCDETLRKDLTRTYGTFIG